MDINSITRLKNAIFQKAYREGDFTLASGQKSSYYIDLKEVTLDGEGSALIGEVLYPVALEWDAQGVGGLELGSVPISTAVCLVAAQKGTRLSNLIVRKEAKGHGTRKAVEGKLVAGMRVMVVEDVVSTGSSSLKAVAALKEAGAQVAGVVTVVDRLMGGAELFEKEGIAFKAIFDIGQIRQD
ncbi:MAG: orotate phosphoribosyltransferase [Nitrospinota bacterium]|nr:orotate phosphoribosyltransferase [Nitrospinota bacterium]